MEGGAFDWLAILGGWEDWGCSDATLGTFFSNYEGQKVGRR